MHRAEFVQRRTLLLQLERRTDVSVRVVSSEYVPCEEHLHLRRSGMSGVVGMPERWRVLQRFVLLPVHAHR